MLASLPCPLGAFVPLHSCKPSRMRLSHVSLSLSFQSPPSRLQTSQLGDAPLPVNPCRVLPQPLLWAHNMGAKCTACTARAVPTRKTFTVTGADHHSHPWGVPRWAALAVHLCLSLTSQADPSRNQAWAFASCPPFPK